MQCGINESPMGEICSIDLALLSFLGVNGRAFSLIDADVDPRDLLESSSLRTVKRMSDSELEAKIEQAEKYRSQLVEFQNQGGQILGLNGGNDLGALLRAPRPPLCAYVRGNAQLLTRPLKVAIVGTRDASQQGVNRAQELARKLSDAGVLVISGGANGIDMAAHMGAIERGFETLAVLGDPLKPLSDERPTRLRSLTPSKLVTCMTLFGPWVKSSRALFVARNQFVAALADAVVIIEGRLKSGTIHTANYANQMGVPVWVVPGDPADEMSEAANWLLERGLARAFVRFEYFLANLTGKELKGSSNLRQMPLIEQTPVPKPKLSQGQEHVLGILRKNQNRMTVDELAEKCETPISALQQELLMLELLGVLKKQGTEFVIL